MDRKLCARYLGGIIANKGEVSRLYIPRTLTFDDERYDIIAKAIVLLVDDKSSMSDLVMLDAIKTQFLLVADEEDWPKSIDWFESFVYSSIECGVTIPEIEELYNIIQRQRLSEQTKLILDKITNRLEFDEGDIDEALHRLRMVKAVYPSKEAKLNEQSAEAVYDALNNSAGVIPYEFKAIDEEIAGICRKEITVIAGRPGHGKTSLVCQFVLNWIQSGKKVLFISKEMPTARLMHKFFSNLGNISSTDIKKGQVEDTEHLESLASSFVRKFKDKLFIYDNVYSSAEMERLVLKHNPDVVVDDFIQMSDFGDLDMRRGIFKTMKHYKTMAKENDCAFVVLSQLSRNIENREDPRPRLSDLAESGSLEQLAGDVCFIFYEYKMTFDAVDKNRVEFIVAKARYGESVTVPLGFDGRMMRYYVTPKFNEVR